MNKINLLGTFTLRATDPDGLYIDQNFILNVLDDTSDNNIPFLNLDSNDLALAEEHLGSDFNDKMDGGEFVK